MIPIYVIYPLAFIFYVLGGLIHILVLNKTIDYKLVNGGRSKDFTEQQKQSLVSIVMIIVFTAYVVVTLLFPEFRTTIYFLIITSLLTLFWLLGTVLQVLGTPFEKKVVVWINLIGLISHILLLLEYFD